MGMGKGVQDGIDKGRESTGVVRGMGGMGMAGARVGSGILGGGPAWSCTGSRRG